MFHERLSRNLLQQQQQQQQQQQKVSETYRSDRICHYDILNTLNTLSSQHKSIVRESSFRSVYSVVFVARLIKT
jgi:hypothetical protein